MKRKNSDDAIIGCGAILLLPFVAVLAWAGQYIHVSDGHRDGVVQKFSHRGILVQTWEGELALEGAKFRMSKAGGSGGNTWAFTVDGDNQAAISTIDALKPNERVRIHYRQSLTTLPWNGETRYRVARVERIESH